MTLKITNVDFNKEHTVYSDIAKIMNKNITNQQKDKYGIDPTGSKPRPLPIMKIVFFPPAIWKYSLLAR
jgi:hypothetical protein